MSHNQSRRDGVSLPARSPHVRDGTEDSGEWGDRSAPITLVSFTIRANNYFISLTTFILRETLRDGTRVDSIAVTVCGEGL